MEPEEAPRGLNWQGFRSWYSKAIGKSKVSTVSEAWTEYKEKYDIESKTKTSEKKTSTKKGKEKEKKTDKGKGKEKEKKGKEKEKEKEKKSDKGKEKVSPIRSKSKSPPRSRSKSSYRSKSVSPTRSKSKKGKEKVKSPTEEERLGLFSTIPAEIRLQILKERGAAAKLSSTGKTFQFEAGGILQKKCELGIEVRYDILPLIDELEEILDSQEALEQLQKGETPKGIIDSKLPRVSQGLNYQKNAHIAIEVAEYPSFVNNNIEIGQNTYKALEIDYSTIRKVTRKGRNVKNAAGELPPLELDRDAMTITLSNNGTASEGIVFKQKITQRKKVRTVTVPQPTSDMIKKEVLAHFPDPNKELIVPVILQHKIYTDRQSCMKRDPFYSAKKIESNIRNQLDRILVLLGVDTQDLLFAHYSRKELEPDTMTQFTGRERERPRAPFISPAVQNNRIAIRNVGAYLVTQQNDSGRDLVQRLPYKTLEQFHRSLRVLEALVYYTRFAFSATQYANLTYGLTIDNVVDDLIVAGELYHKIRRLVEDSIEFGFYGRTSNRKTMFFLAQKVVPTIPLRIGYKAIYE